MERETQETSKIPIVSWIKKDFTLNKTEYMSIAMIGTVLTASLVNIFYALAVYASHPNISSLESAQIPALYLAQEELGRGVETLMAAAFLIATFTTFVPSFMAATRHISSLAEDGFMPSSISRIAWVFVLISIGILSVGGENFLVSITDFMVLVSLGMISFSAIWLVKVRKSAIGSHDFLPLIVGLGCFAAAAAVYLFDPPVAVFGSLAVLVAYLLFDIFESWFAGNRALSWNVQLGDVYIPELLLSRVRFTELHPVQIARNTAAVDKCVSRNNAGLKRTSAR